MDCFRPGIVGEDDQGRVIFGAVVFASLHEGEMDEMA